MKHHPTVFGVMAVMVLVLSLAGVAHALPGCVGLGGTIVAAECRVSTALSSSGSFEIESGLSLHLLNSGGNVGSITTGGADLSILVHGDLIMDVGTVIDANKTGGTCPTGGKITLTVDGLVSTQPGSIIRSDSCSGGAIQITAGKAVDIGGVVESVGSNKSAFGAGNVAPGGGMITIETPCNLTVTNDGVVSSRGADPGADLVRLVGGCFVKVFGLVESTGIGHRTPNAPPNHCSGGFRPGKPANSTSCVEIVSGGSLLIASTAPHNGQINADNGGVGGGGATWVDLFARGAIQIVGDVVAPFAVHANGLSGANDTGGTITVKSKDESVSASGLALQADSTRNAEDGGVIVIDAKTAVVLDDGQVFARGDSNPSYGFGSGGQVIVRAFNGALSWKDTAAVPASVGDVTPTGTTVPLAQRGIINLTACGAVTTTGTSFPTNGSPVPPFPATTTGACGGSPTLPAYITLPTCTCAEPLFGIHVVKVTCPANDPTIFSVSASGAGTVVTQSPQSLSTSQAVDFQVTQGTYSITEAPLAGWTQTGNTCTNLVVDANHAQVTCTITNESAACNPGHLIVNKVTCPVNDPTVFSVTASGSGSITNGSATRNLSTSASVDYQVTPGTYSVTEAAKIGWTQVTNTCTNVVVGSGQTVQCTITNQSAACNPGHVTLSLVTCPLNDPTVFSVTASGSGNITNGPATRDLSNGITLDFQVIPGTYSVNPTPKGGWDLIGNTCTNLVVGAGQSLQCQLTLSRPDVCNHTPLCTQDLVLAVLDPQTGRFPGNKGPDVVVDVRTGSIQQALDTVTDVNGDGYIIVGVVGADGGAPGGIGSEELHITRVYNKSFALIACGVTLQDPIVCDGVAPITIQASATSPPLPPFVYDAGLPAAAGVTIYVQGFTNTGSTSSAGWVVQGSGRFLESIGAQGNLTGAQITGDGNIVHNAAMNGNFGSGLVVQGNGNTVDGVLASANGGGDGVQVSGNNNIIINNLIGTLKARNGANGITVNGAGNQVLSNQSFRNIGDGINVSGGIVSNPNIVKFNTAGGPTNGNLGNGIVLGGTGNGTSSPIELEGNVTQTNSLDGILVTGTGHQLKNNTSGGVLFSGRRNGQCPFDVAAGNINATGNISNGVAIPGANGSAFPTGCH